MKLVNLKTIIGKGPLPETTMERIRLAVFADANHVLGQWAHCFSKLPEGGLGDVLNNAKLRAAHDHTMLTFELNRLERALSGSGLKVVVLKGGAYVANAYKAAKGRRVSDLDILVASNDLAEVEKLLTAAGWGPEEQTDNEYDQQYYRQHMHELPPLRHKSRGTVIDVHHAILPRTARQNIDSAAMYEDADKVAGRTFYTFTDVDIFIHSAVHAYADGAVDAPVRTLVEQYLLFSELSQKARDTLPLRAKELGASSAVATAPWLVGGLFDEEVASDIAAAMQPDWRYFLTKRAILAKAADGWTAPLGKAYLYVRSHYLRMPLYLLIPHLLRKAARWRPGQEQPIELPKP